MKISELLSVVLDAWRKSQWWSRTHSTTEPQGIFNKLLLSRLISHSAGTLSKSKMANGKSTILVRQRQTAIDKMFNCCVVV